jgi:hypothetical protein
VSDQTVNSALADTPTVMRASTVGVSAVPTGSVLISDAAAGSGKRTDREHESKAPEVIVMDRPSNGERSVCK